MKTLFFLTLLTGVLSSFETSAYYIGDKGVYGEDNRKLMSELDPNIDNFELEQSRSVLAQIPKWRITAEDKESISIRTKSLGNGLKFCPDERFSELPIVSSCSAFMVAPDLILTAGHCVKDKYECQKNYWVLDYNDAAGLEGASGNVSFNKENVYSCAQILSWSENPKLDYALIRLNRKITDRKPLTIRRNGKVEDSDSLSVIGHPMGLPKIITNEAMIRNNSLIYTFLTNADTFSGNSGSPVINPKTKLVEGMLIRGDEDFRMDIDLGCNRIVRCLRKDCRGETVQRTTVLPLKLIPKI